MICIFGKADRGNVRDADILNAKLIKGWAKGKRKMFLLSHLESYKAALLVSSDKADKLLDNIVNLWFAKFHWSIPTSVTHQVLTNSWDKMANDPS